MKAIDLEDEEEEVQGFLFHFLTCCTKQRHECFVSTAVSQWLVARKSKNTTPSPRCLLA